MNTATSLAARTLSLATALICCCSTHAALAQIAATAEHKILKADVGAWDATVKMYPQPGAEPQESKATETNEMLGDLWMVSKFEGKIDEMPFSGRGAFGYDPAEKKYVGVWIDTMSTSPMTTKGNYDAATKTLTMTGEIRQPTGEMAKTRQVSRSIDNDNRTFEMTVPGPDGKEWKMMEIHYKRQK